MSKIIEEYGAFFTLVIMGIVLICMTLLKTLGYFASSAVMVPLRTGIVRDIRIEVYNKVLKLPLSFFSEERKGDIIARMSADVTVVENSITSSIDMLIRNPIALLVCFITLFTVSWQLTLFVIVILPLAGWIIEKPVSGGAGTMGRYYVTIRRNLGRASYYKSFYCRA